MDLPTFRYHPDPVATGSVERSDAECACCSRRRGYVYVGPEFSEEDLSGRVCPWCIADGSAHAKFDAEFLDPEGIGGYPRSLVIPQAVIEEVAFRTPCFLGWQQERWLACCGDAAAFVGRAGRVELEQQWLDAAPSIRQDRTTIDDANWQAYFRALDKDGSPSAYVFQCLHCGKRLGYSDSC